MRNKRDINGGGYGAPVERGTVRSIHDGRAIVVSLDRDGLVTRPLQMMGKAAEGDAVFFCQFDDGTGVLFAKIELEGE